MFDLPPVRCEDFATMKPNSLRRANLNLLIVFDMLMEERHVGRAAKRLNQSQSAISHSLSRLREVFNDPLFVRHPKGVTPTPRARGLSERVSHILDAANAVLAPSSFDAGEARTFVIGATDGSISAVLIPLLSLLRKKAPKVAVRIKQIRPENVVDAIDAMDIDIALTVFTHKVQRVSSFPIRKMNFVGIARRGHPALRRRAMTPQAYAQLPHLLVSTESDPRSAEDIQLAALGLKREIVVVEPHFLAAPQIVATTDLVATVDLRLATLFSKTHGIQTFELPFAMPSLSIDLLVSSARLSEPPLEWLCAQIIESNR